MTDTDVKIEFDPNDHSGVIQNLCAAALEGDLEGNLASFIRGRRSAWTAEGLGELLGWSPKHVYKLASDGRMPSYRLGGSVRFDPQAVADWLEAKATG
jgi:excisionase family DNA binding protein